MHKKSVNKWYRHYTTWLARLCFVWTYLARLAAARRPFRPRITSRSIGIQLSLSDQTFVEKVDWCRVMQMIWTVVLLLTRLVRFQEFTFDLSVRISRSLFRWSWPSSFSFPVKIDLKFAKQRIFCDVAQQRLCVLFSWQIYNISSPRTWIIFNMLNLSRRFRNQTAPQLVNFLDWTGVFSSEFAHPRFIWVVVARRHLKRVGEVKCHFINNGLS